MRSPESMPSLAVTNDAELVVACLSGDRGAFGQIVERYQRLLCSLAYSSTGQLSQSEDLAQEAFVEAWRQLGTLREPDKLRPWLCGILRFKVSRLRRSDRREPVRDADSIESAHEIATTDSPASDVAIQKEEQAIMWSALERVPESYREPLILYYREHQSVEHVAAALDLTEDNVKQRLARGRKILQEQVMLFVEGALRRSTPGRVFTLGVLAALPEFSAATPAKAAMIGAAAAKGGLLAKTTGIAAYVASLSGVVTAVLTLRANLDQARTPRERRAVVKITVGVFFGAFGFLGVFWLLRLAAFHWWEQRLLFAAVCQIFVVAFIAAWPFALLRIMKNMRALRSAERQAHPHLFTHPIDQIGSSAGEYKSASTFLGIPWVHARFSSPDEGDPPVFAWFAGGDRAYGLIAAWGGLAVAPFSMGAVSIGLLSIGSLSVGIISIGTVGVGAIVTGCAAVGVKASAWLSALGWSTAQSGGFALAGRAAEGPVAFARHANDAISRQLFAAPTADQNQYIFFIVISVLTIIPVAYYAHAVRKRLGRPR